MGLKDIQDNILQNKETSLVKISGESTLEKQASEHYKMANSFCKIKNFSNAFFMYLASLREYSVLFVSKNFGINLDFEDALDFLAKKEKFSMDAEVLTKIRKTADICLNRGKLARKDCDKIKRILAGLRDELKE